MKKELQWCGSFNHNASLRRGNKISIFSNVFDKAISHNYLNKEIAAPLFDGTQ